MFLVTDVHEATERGIVTANTGDLGIDPEVGAVVTMRGVLEEVEAIADGDIKKVFRRLFWVYWILVELVL